MNNNNFHIVSKIKYYVLYILHKILIFYDCKVGALDIYRAEIIWFMGHVFKLCDPYKQQFTRTKFVTRLGKFEVAPTMNGTYIVSPAFERVDMDYLIRIIGVELKNNKKVLFLDIGAYFGLYSVAIGNEFSKYSNNLKIIAFEPEASNFFDNNCKMIRKNIKINNIKNFTLYKVGAGSINANKPNKFGITPKKIDSVLSMKLADKFDHIFMKLDIEGAETDALIGSTKLIQKCKKFTLMVEDFVDLRINTYLETHMSFITKISPLNSFWEKL